MLSSSPSSPWLVVYEAHDVAGAVGCDGWCVAVVVIYFPPPLLRSAFFPQKKNNKTTVGAGSCIEEGGDPVPHLEALDPILAELTELETRVKKAPTEEVDDARYVHMHTYIHACI